MIRLLLVHPTRMTCELLAAVLREESDIHVVGYAHSSDEALTQVSKQKCNTVLVDINMPNHSALPFARNLRQTGQEVKVLITGLVKSNAAILQCIEEGVAGYVLEEDSLADLVKKIRAVHEEKFLVSPTVASALMARIAELKQMTKELYGISLNQAGDLFTELTPREWEVLQLIEQGCNNQQIADKLVIEKGTVKNHVHNILDKLDVHCREQAALLARQLFANHCEEEAVPADSLRTLPLMEAWEATMLRGNRSKQMALA
ncbi:MAG: response regulator transcription factor [Caldilineaceae bacterium]